MRRPCSPSFGHFYGIALERKQHLERLADARFVVDDKDAGAGVLDAETGPDAERFKGCSTSDMY